jgi:hypothetical protein
MTTKPSKPAADFPLLAHGGGQSAQKIDGRLRCFGPWGDPYAALGKYEAEYLTTSASPKAAQSSTQPIKIPSRPKPGKPYADYPHFAHAAVRGRKKSAADYTTFTAPHRSFEPPSTTFD